MMMISTVAHRRLVLRLPLYLLLLLLLLLACLSRGASETEDLYRVLGVRKSATSKEIKSAYRRRALATHPDKTPDIPPEEAAAQFHKVVQAFETLSDKDSRRYYDRTGKTTEQQQQQRQQQRQHQHHQKKNNGWKWGPPNNQGNQRRNDRQRMEERKRLQQEFKVKEAMNRVVHIVSLSQLETLMMDTDETSSSPTEEVLERNLLMVFVTPGDVETVCDETIHFPYPFAAMSEQGIWWEDMLQTAKVRYNNMNDLTRFFNVPHGDTLRKTKRPIFLFGRRGQTLKVENFARIQTDSQDDFETWMWKQIEIEVTFRNDHPHPVELFWIHGSQAHDKGTMESGQSMKMLTMLSHEWWIRDGRVDQREDSPGRHKLSKESSVALWKITSDEQHRELVIAPKSCLDLSGHCLWWWRQAECRKNPEFMQEYCALTCGHCSEENDVYKSTDHKKKKK